MDHYHHHRQYHNQMVISNNPFSNNTTSCSSTPPPAAPPPPPTRATPAFDQKKMTRPREHLNCPRCNSTNTKFCYYNNYSLTQPRYLCKTCRRYWTEGGSLRNVPVGGGSRKNKKLPSSTSSSSSSTKINLPDLNPPFLSSSPHHLNPNKNKPHRDHQDLSLSFSDPMQDSQAQGHFCSFSHHLKTNIINPSTGVSGQNFNFMTALEPNTVYNNNNNNSLPGLIHFHHPYNNKASLGFSLVGQEEEMSHHDVVHGGSRVLFPFGDIKQLIPTTTTHNQVRHEDHHHHHQEQHSVVNKRSQGNSPSNELWNGIILGGGPTW